MSKAPQAVLVVVPFRNERTYLPELAAALAAQTYPRSAWRVVFVDDGSSDGGDRWLRDWVAGSGVTAEVLSAPHASIPATLNAGLRRARIDEIVVRMDAHSVYGPAYLADIVAAFARLPADVWCVGGAQEPREPGDFDRRLVAAAMTNPFGLGGAAFRRATAPRPVASVYLGAWRPGVLARLGGFDERWRANEDAELAARIYEAGGTVWWIPLPSQYTITRGAAATARQWFTYGSWRARTCKAHPGTLRLRHVAPLVALIVAAVGALVAWPVVAVLALVYAVLVIRGRRPGENPFVTAASLAYFPLLQLAYAGGFACGLGLSYGRSGLR